jgi:hypothetical protein
VHIINHLKIAIPYIISLNYKNLKVLNFFQIAIFLMHVWYIIQSSLASFTMHALKLYNICYMIKKNHWAMYVSCIVNYARVDCI